MNYRTKIIAIAAVGAAAITTMATASASSDRVGGTEQASRSTAAAAFELLSQPATERADPSLFDAITQAVARNFGVSEVGSIDDARNVGASERGIVGVVAPQRDGGLCFKLEQRGTVGTGGCVDEFPAAGYAGAHGVVADEFSLMGLVARDVTTLSLELGDGTVHPLSVADGVYSWTSPTDDAAPLAIITKRAGATHRDVIDLAATLAESRTQQAPPASHVIP